MYDAYVVLFEPPPPVYTVLLLYRYSPVYAALNSWKQHPAACRGAELAGFVRWTRPRTYRVA